MLHAGLTVWGKRNLWVQLAEAAPGGQEWKKFPQQPGAFYIGNLCAPWHQVGHFAPAQAEPLFQRGDGGTGVHVTVMVRSDVFAHARARCSSNVAIPVEVYRAGNAVVAKNLATRPLRMPTFTKCLSMESDGALGTKNRAEGEFLLAVLPAAGERECVCVRVRVCVRACVSVSVSVRVSVSVSVSERERRERERRETTEGPAQSTA